MPETIIRVEHVKKIFHVGTQDIEILKDLSFTIEKGDFVVISGPSGCGKSTMLHILLGLEPPTAGKLLFFDQDMYLNTVEDDRSIFRKRNIGMVYQQANWIKALNVRENVSFPLTLLGVSKHEAFTKSLKVLNDLGMGSWAEYAPLELSSGQQQRVALARALINDPKVIVADEPTGNLDFKSGMEIMELLSKLNKELQKTIIMVTHDLEYLKYSNKVVRIFDGVLEGVYTGDALQKLIGSVSLKRGATTEEAVAADKATTTPAVPAVVQMGTSAVSPISGENASENSQSNTTVSTNVISPTTNLVTPTDTASQTSPTPLIQTTDPSTGVTNAVVNTDTLGTTNPINADSKIASPVNPQTNKDAVPEHGTTVSGMSLQHAGEAPSFKKGDLASKNSIKITSFSGIVAPPGQEQTQESDALSDTNEKPHENVVTEKIVTEKLDTSLKESVKITSDTVKSDETKSDEIKSDETRISDTKSVDKKSATSEESVESAESTESTESVETVESVSSLVGGGVPVGKSTKHKKFFIRHKKM